jgi:hypothetical protein
MSTEAGHDPALDNETNGPSIIAVAVTLVALSSLVTGLRVYTRVHIICNFKADDYAICLAQVRPVMMVRATAEWRL